MGIVVDEKGDFLGRDLAILDSESEEDLKFLIDEKGYFNNKFSDSLHKLLGLLKITKVVNEGEREEKYTFKSHVILEWKDDFKEVVEERIQGFMKCYVKLLACEDVLKKVSEVLEIDVAYKVSMWIKSLQTQVREYNSTIEEALLRSRPSFVEIRFQSKETFYINMEQAQADGNIFKETIEHFEAVLGKEMERE